jgi:hypothetical protein
VPTPAFPFPAPTMVHVSVHIDSASEPSSMSHLQKESCSRYLVDSATIIGGPETYL